MLSAVLVTLAGLWQATAFVAMLWALGVIIADSRGRR